MLFSLLICFVGTVIALLVAHTRRCEGYIHVAAIIIWPVGLILALLFPGDKPRELSVEERYTDISHRLEGLKIKD